MVFLILSRPQVSRKELCLRRFIPISFPNYFATEEGFKHVADVQFNLMASFHDRQPNIR